MVWLQLILMASSICRPAAQPASAVSTRTCSGGDATHTTHDISGQLDPYLRWDKPIPEGTRLCRLKVLLEKQASVLPARDLEDRSPLPKWFRVLMRKQHPDLSASGPYQYPKTANRVLQGLLDKPDAETIDQLLELYAR
jgi:hypothetical protein